MYVVCNYNDIILRASTDEVELKVHIPDGLMMEFDIHNRRLRLPFRDWKQGFVFASQWFMVEYCRDRAAYDRAKRDFTSVYGELSDEGLLMVLFPRVLYESLIKPYDRTIGFQAEYAFFALVARMRSNGAFFDALFREHDIIGRSVLPPLERPLTFSLPSETEGRMRECVASGMYSGTEDFVLSALRHALAGDPVGPASDTPKEEGRTLHSMALRSWMLEDIGVLASSLGVDPEGFVAIAIDTEIRRVMPIIEDKKRKRQQRR